MTNKRPPTLTAPGVLEITNTTGDPFRVELTLDGEPLTSVVRLKLDVEIEQGIAKVFEQGQFAALPVEVHFINPRYRLIADPVFPQYVDAEIRAALGAALLESLDARLDVWSVSEYPAENSAAVLVSNLLDELIPNAAARVSSAFNRPVSPEQFGFVRQSPANEGSNNDVSRGRQTDSGERAAGDG